MIATICKEEAFSHLLEDDCNVIFLHATHQKKTEEEEKKKKNILIINTYIIIENMQS